MYRVSLGQVLVDAEGQVPAEQVDILRGYGPRLTHLLDGPWVDAAGAVEHVPEISHASGRKVAAQDADQRRPGSLGDVDEYGQRAAAGRCRIGSPWGSALPLRAAYSRRASTLAPPDAAVVCSSFKTPPPPMDGL